MKSFNILLSICLIVLIFLQGSYSHGSTTHKKSPKQIISCDECKIGAELVESLLKINSSTTTIIDAVTELCTISKMEQPDVCQGILTNYLPIIIDVILQSELSPVDLCGYFKLCDNVTSSDRDHYYSYEGERTNFREKRIFTEISKQKVKIPIKSNSTTGYFLQIADIHYDSSYLVGSDPNCGKPLCCRDGTGDAGVWGNYLCDLPFGTVQAIFQHLSTLEQQLDFIVWTGDNPPHNVWDPDAKSNQIDATQVLSALVLKSFPNTPVFPSMGNHESFPSDEFYLPNTQWLLDVLYDSWEPWLDAEALATVKQYGFYTSLIRPGLRLISLNTLDGDMINFYNLLPTKAVNQTAWFVDVLEQAQQSSESVMIIGHIPCTLKSGVSDDWCQIYQTILDRFSSIITGQIYGHTHDDQFSVFTESSNSDVATGVHYIAPSVTTFQLHEPAYRIYEYDYSTNQITNYYQYHANITAANINGYINFTLTYSAKEAYNMPDLTPTSWFNVANEFKTNDQLFNTYYLYSTNNQNNTVPPCDQECRSKIICEVFGVTSYIFDECLGV